jgi:hypothetical protein
MMHSFNWLEEPKGTTFRWKTNEIIEEVFRKQPLESKPYSLYPAKKPLQPIMGNDCNHVIHGKKEIHIHASGRFLE